MTERKELIETTAVSMHGITPNGESTEKWAFNGPGFRGSIKQILNCARCGEGDFNGPGHYRDIFKPTFHLLCDDCFISLDRGKIS